jgi:hypothetical protein
LQGSYPLFCAAYSIPHISPRVVLLPMKRDSLERPEGINMEKVKY